MRNLRHARTRILQVSLMQAGFFSLRRARDALEIHISFLKTGFCGGLRNIIGPFAGLVVPSLLQKPKPPPPPKKSLLELGGRLVSGGSLCAPDGIGV